MSRADAKKVAERLFGPKVELVRVSAINRHERFVVALGSFVLEQGARPDPLVLGSGDSWSAAIDHSQTTPNGKMAVERHRAGIELANKAMDAGTPEAFADIVEAAAIEEATKEGLPEEAIVALKKRFADARAKIGTNDHADRQPHSDHGKEAGSPGGDHHEGPRSEGEQAREGVHEAPGAGV